MAKQNRGRLIADEIVSILGDMSSPEYPFAARRARLPRVKADELDGSTADVTVAPMSKAGDEQDRGSESLLYGITVGVTAHVGDLDSAEADLVDDLVEQIQNYLSEEVNREISLGADEGDLDHYADLELPYIADPIFNVQIGRELGIYQSVTIFQYLIETRRI